ncbi:hypothetical protein EV126DRAFT_50189 [Verticillium dahliae]|nr:hypothetical protein EV126DRAFT_50189 [Verticillium dahliae]
MAWSVAMSVISVDGAYCLGTFGVFGPWHVSSEWTEHNPATQRSCYISSPLVLVALPSLHLSLPRIPYSVPIAQSLVQADMFFDLTPSDPFPPNQQHIYP